MRARTWQALCLAVFFAAFVPAALACQIAAHSHPGSMEQSCDASNGSMRCVGESALSTPSLLTIKGVYPSALPHVGPVAGLTGRYAAAPLPMRHPAVAGGFKSPQPTLHDLRVLFRI